MPQKGWIFPRWGMYWMRFLKLRWQMWMWSLFPATIFWFSRILSEMLFRGSWGSYFWFWFAGLCWLCVPEELHIHIKAPFISIYMHVGCNYIMSVWEMQTHVHQVWVLKWLNWIACWFVVKAISWQWWHTGPLVAFWVLLVRCFTNSIFVYEPAHVGPARMNHVSFALEFKSTVQHFINVSDLHDGWSLPLNYI